jgi:hypothetical protein
MARTFMRQNGSYIRWPFVYRINFMHSHMLDHATKNSSAVSGQRKLIRLSLWAVNFRVLFIHAGFHRELNGPQKLRHL